MSAAWQTLRLTSGDLELVVLPGIGGRLWDVVFAGRSLLFQNPDLSGQSPDLDTLSDLPTRSPQFNFPLWGGEKTWIAPDSSWVENAPFPTLDSGPYRVSDRDQSSLALESQVCPLTGLVIQRRIGLKNSNRWILHHEVHNSGPMKRHTGIWSVLMLNQPVRIGLAGAPNQTIKRVFGEAGALNKSSGSFIRFDCTSLQEFKSGMFNPRGRVFMQLGGPKDPIWIQCSTAPAKRNDRFAHGHNFEVFNSGDYPYCETEWHAPACHLEPGQSTSFVQHFRIWSGSYRHSGDKLQAEEEELLECMSL